jgi:hypothetical protein
MSLRGSWISIRLLVGGLPGVAIGLLVGGLLGVTITGFESLSGTSSPNSFAGIESLKSEVKAFVPLGYTILKVISPTHCCKNLKARKPPTCDPFRGNSL